MQFTAQPLARAIATALVLSVPFDAAAQTGATAPQAASVPALGSPPAAAVLKDLNLMYGGLYVSGRTVEFEQMMGTDRTIAHRQNALAYETRPTVWAEAVGAEGGIYRYGLDGNDYRFSGSMLGVDVPVNRRWAFGLAVGRLRGDTALFTWSQGYLDSREDLGYAYGRWTIGDGWHLDADAGEASFRNGVGRLTHGVDSSARVDRSEAGVLAGYDDSVQTVSLGIGKTFHAGRYGFVTPHLQWTGLRLRQGTIVEHGGQLAVNAPAQTHDVDMLTAGAGYRLAFDRGAYGLRLYLNYHRLTAGDSMTMLGSYTGVTATPLLIHGQNLPRDFDTIGLDLHAKLTRRLGFTADGVYQNGNQHNRGATFDVGLTYRF